MKNKTTVLMLFLSTASIGGGMALKNVLNYSMIIGVSLEVIFLLVAAYSLGKENKEIIHLIKSKDGK